MFIHTHYEKLIENSAKHLALELSIGMLPLPTSKSLSHLNILLAYLTHLRLLEDISRSILVFPVQQGFIGGMRVVCSEANITTHHER